MTTNFQLPQLKGLGTWFGFVFVLTTGGFLALLIFSFMAYQVLYLDRIYPGVQVDGMDMGGLSVAEAEARFAPRLEAYHSRTITVQAGDRQWTRSVQALGLSVDMGTTIQRAYAVGRQGNLLVDSLIQFRLLYRPHNVTPVIVYDPTPLDPVLQAMAAEVYVPPKNAELTILPDGRVEMLHAQRGRQLHTASTRTAMEKAVLNEQAAPIQAVVQEIIPPITEEHLAEARQLASTLLNGPLTLRHTPTTGDPREWQLSPAELAHLFTLVSTVDETGQTRPVLRFQPERFEPYLLDYAETIQAEPQDARFDFNPTTRQLTVLQESQYGYRLDEATTYARMQSLATEPRRLIDLPVLTITPTITSTNVADLGITDLVAEATSYFMGSSAGRMNNIKVAADKFQNVVIPAGEVFSFNEHLGEVTAENGYDESLIIFGDRTTVGIGGGVCQVSTTAFRAALFGGYEIVERWAHGYRVSWYEINSVPGLDATIYTPYVDVKFRNDTPHALLIRTVTDLAAGTLTFQFYSTPTERDIALGEPDIVETIPHGPPIYEDDPDLPRGTTKQVDWANEGMVVVVTRTVTLSDTVLHNDVIRSEYEPWEAVYKVGTGPQD